MIESIFRNRVVRRRMADSHLGIILHEFAIYLRQRGHALTLIRAYCPIAEHFARWLALQRLKPRQISEVVVERFLRRHLPRCKCPKPAAKCHETCHAALRSLLIFLRQRGLNREKPSAPPSVIDELVQEYDQYLNDVAGLASTTRKYLRRYAREFLQTRRIRLRIRRGTLGPSDLNDYVQCRVQRLKPASIRSILSSLRGFLRFLHLTGRGDKRWVEAVPRAAPWPRRLLPQILSEEQYRAFVNSFDRTTRTGRRDFAMALCLGQMGLRTEEVAALTLEDVDWCHLTLHLRRTKQRRERVLPLPPTVARAMISYLRRGRPVTNSRALFVRHQAPLGEALRAHHVRGAMLRAFARCGIIARTHLLRHTFATRLHRRGVGLKAIADLLGHRDLETTAGYARVNLDELRQAALPWPEVWR